VPQPIFDAQLGQLHRDGWQFVSAESVIKALTGEELLPPQAALLTFDDGYRSLLEYALPVLSEHRCPAVVFVPTDHVGGDNAFEGGGEREPREPLCDWDELGRLEEAGVAVQSHGASHTPFSELSPADLRAEVSASKAAIEERLGRPVRFLAYPYGDSGTDPHLTGDLLEQAGYDAACLYGGGPFDPWQADRFRLERIEVRADTDLATKLNEPPKRGPTEWR
jgi:peptidoglycan/xylan/chitin deacetylase (PgdA/CDA1 family)